MLYYACYSDVEEIFPDRREYYEFGTDGYPTRSVFVYPDAVVHTGDRDQSLPGSVLADQPIRYWDLTGMVRIAPG